MGVKYFEYNNLAAACFSHATNLKIYKLGTGKIKEYKFEIYTPLALVRNLFITNFMFSLAPSHSVFLSQLTLCLAVPDHLQSNTILRPQLCLLAVEGGAEGDCSPPSKEEPAVSSRGSRTPLLKQFNPYNSKSSHSQGYGLNLETTTVNTVVAMVLL